MLAYLTPDQWQALMAKVKDKDPLHDFVTFLRETGCRPQKARAAEARHFDRINQQLAFPVKESKGKRESRIIPLNDKALAIVICDNNVFNESSTRSASVQPWA